MMKYIVAESVEAVYTSNLINNIKVYKARDGNRYQKYDIYYGLFVV